jgi:acetolactate synthase-1/2/3 large subunit
MVKSKKLLEYLIDYLVYNNIDTFFLVTGGAIAPTIDYIGTKKGAKYYCFQNEQPASMAAEAYYRVTGKMGVVLSTSGPGAQNVFNGVCGCWYESIPCLFLTGQVSTYESIDYIETKPRQVGFQETPIVEAFKPFTKYAKKITDPSTFEEDLQEALMASFEGRPGPVLLDLPVDMQNSIIEYNDKLSTLPPIKLIIDSELNNKINKLNDKIKESKRPLLVLGHGIRLSKSLKEIKELDNNNLNLETMQLKKPNQVYYELYKEARKKAKEAKKNAIIAYLEAKNIKKTYMIENIEDSESEFDAEIDEVSESELDDF